MKVKVAVLGDMEVTVKYRVGIADRYFGDVSDYVDEWDIIEISGEPISKYLLAWIDSSLSRLDIKRILAACYDDMGKKNTNSVVKCDFDLEC